MFRPNWDDTWLEVANVVAKRSLCVRDQVGAVIVSATNRIISTGYNGPPSGFEHDEHPCSQWCTRAVTNAQYGWKVESSNPRFAELEVTTESGKTWVKWGSHVRELTPRLAEQLGIQPVYTELAADYSDCPSLHAEANALSVCDRLVREGGTIYVTSHVCFNCAKLIANSGLTTLHVSAVALPESRVQHRDPRKSYDFLERCGVTVYVT